LIGTTTLSLDENQGDGVTPKFRWSGFMLCLVSPRQRLRPTRQMHTDGKKRCSFVALLFAAGDLRR